MTASNIRRLRIWLILVALAGVGFLFHEQIIGRVAYAVEKGKLEAGQERLNLANVEAISEVFRLVARQVKPAVVHITTIAEPEKRELRNPTRSEIDPDDVPEPFREFFRRWDRGLQIPDPAPREGSGSGVIIDAEAGYVITNHHVIEGVKERGGRIDVRLSDGRRVKGEVVGDDPKTDLALIRINADRLHALPLGDSEKMEVGDWVLAIGAPFGLAQTVTQGIISAKGRSHILQIGYEDLIQTDAAINPGNSGGPLVNMRGEMIGINVAIATNGLLRGYMGVGFAIPSRTIEDILPDLREGRDVVRGYLGVSIRGLDSFAPGIGRTYGLDEDAGILIEEVQPGTPASKAGLKMDDVILEYDGQRMESATQLQALVARTEPGTKVDVLVWRDRKEITIPVTIEKQPKDFFLTARRGRGTPRPGGDEEGAPVTIETLGMTVQPLTGELIKKYGWEREEKDVEGLIVVTEVEPLGEARALGIKKGDLIISVQGQRVKTARELEEALSEEALAEGVRVRVKTSSFGYRTFYLRISPSSRRK